MIASMNPDARQAAPGPVQAGRRSRRSSIDGEGVGLVALRQLVSDLQRTTLILIAVSAFLAPAAAISLCALLWKWRRRRVMEMKSIEHGTKTTLAALAKRNALDFELHHKPPHRMRSTDQVV